MDPNAKYNRHSIAFTSLSFTGQRKSKKQKPTVPSLFGKGMGPSTTQLQGHIQYRQVVQIDYHSLRER